jgi:hypothetical protein
MICPICFCCCTLLLLLLRSCYQCWIWRPSCCSYSSSSSILQLLLLLLPAMSHCWGSIRVTSLLLLLLPKLISGCPKLRPCITAAAGRVLQQAH